MNEKLTQRVLRGLEGQPAYVLILAVVLVLFGVGGTVATISSPQIGGALSALALVAVVVVIGLVQRSATSQPRQANLGDNDLDRIFQAIASNVREAVAVGHPIFTERIREACREFQSDSAGWAHRQLRLARRDYNQLLVRTYRNAKKTIFATCTPEFFSTLRENIGREILKAHADSKAQKTRVFIFKDRSGISQEAIEIMKEHHKAGIVVRLYVEELDDVFEWPPNFSKNFAVIDGGEMIAVADQLDHGTNAGTWFFKDDNRVAFYLNVVEGLEPATLTVQEFSQKHMPQLAKEFEARPAPTAASEAPLMEAAAVPEVPNQEIKETA